MKSVLLFLTLIALFVPAAKAQQSPAEIEKLLRARTQEYMTARQARKGEAMSRFYDGEDIKQIDDFLKFQYVSIKADLQKGLFTKAYVQSSVEDSPFGEAYKTAILNYLFKNADLDKELALAFPRYLTEYKYLLTQFKIGRVLLAPDGKSATVEVVEYRSLPSAQQPAAVPHPLKWNLKKNGWYLNTEDPANL